MQFALLIFESPEAFAARRRVTRRPRRTSGGIGTTTMTPRPGLTPWVKVSDAGEAAFRRNDPDAKAS